MKILSIIVLVLITAGCASVSVTPPVVADFEKSRTYQLPFDSVWNRSVDWFADHNVIIDKIEKPSGLLTAKYLIKTDDKYLDCGEIDVSGTLNEPYIEKYGTLNVTVRSITDNETKINVNFFGEYKIRANDAWDGRLVTANGRCVSTGNLEKSIMSYIVR